MMTEEDIASEGLDISGYAGKWKIAQELALKNEGSNNDRLLPYWERVRLIFLELGGKYITEKRRC